MNSVRFGIDVVAGQPGLLPGRWGLVTNAAARAAQPPLEPSRQALLRSGVQIDRLFSPEHGLETKAADGAAVADGVDALTGLPVVSLYGERMAPSRESLQGLDGVVFDIPDIGARFYTYIWTLWHVREVCAAAGVPLVVLDRPNPLGGDLESVEGPMLEVARHASFLGRASMPIRHGLTVGELARLWNAEAETKAVLRVVACEGWHRQALWPDTGLPFERTSPAMPCFESALLYPGLCLFEATNLSVGRGTDAPFQCLAAPWLNAQELAGMIQRWHPPGVRVLAEEVVPAQEPWAGQRCRAVRFQVEEARAVRPVALGLALLAGIKMLQARDFQWATYPTAANPSGEGHFERLIGRSGVRPWIEAYPRMVFEQLDEWTAVSGWLTRVRPHLLYPPGRLTTR